jgi:hypothetical protein
MRESGKAIDQAAVEKATLIDAQAGGAGLFVHKNALATRTNGRSWKKIRSDSRTLERQLAHFFLSMWRRGRYALGP